MADSYVERTEAHWRGSPDARPVMREWYKPSGERVMTLSCGHTVPHDGEQHFGTGDPFAYCPPCNGDDHPKHCEGCNDCEDETWGDYYWGLE